MTVDSIIFPGLGIVLKHVGRGIDIHGFNIAYYGCVIALGMLIAYAYIAFNAKRYGEDPDAFSDIFLVGIISGVIGARLYYVIFSFDEYRGHLLSVFNLREGGLGIFGGIIAGAISVFVMSRIKKIPFLKAGDVVIGGVLIGQILGRYGNFFNREAFGEYTNGFLRMGLPVESVRNSADITQKMLEHVETIDGVDFIFVHPTFLYESLWNLLTLIIIIWLGGRKHKTGMAAGIYFLLYGIGRFFIERLRTDQLLIPGTSIPVSMVVALCAIVFSLCIMLRHEDEA